MIIFGTKSTRKTLDSGTFGCPQCQREQAFQKRRAKQWFHLYFIPIIPLKEYPPYVECKGCNATFVEGVLNANADSDAIRAEFETATLKILARMAWADGVIEPEEKDAIFDIVNRICAKEFSRAEVEQGLAEAKDSPEDALAVATKVGNMLNDGGKEMIVQAVYLIAASDGDFAQEEKEMLLEIGAGLGLRPAHIKGILADMATSETTLQG
jgi:tellurite resistance protein